MQINLFSFGFKYGMPRKANFLFDVRCLDNPYWVKDLRSKTGLDKEVIEFLSSQELANKMENDIFNFLSNWIDVFQKKDRHHLDIWIGCTGGQHRSVYLCEKIANKLKDNYPLICSHHREQEKW